MKKIFERRIYSAANFSVRDEPLVEPNLFCALYIRLWAEALSVEMQSGTLNTLGKG